MASRRNDDPGRGAANAIKAAAAVATPDDDEPDISAAANKMICIRLNDYEHRKMKALFSKREFP